MPENKIDKDLIKELPEFVQKCEALRKGKGQDISLAEFVQASRQMEMASFYDKLGVNPDRDTISNLVDMPDKELRWLIPEVFRDAIRLGLRKAPIYPQIIAQELSVSQKTLTMPAINMSDATPKRVEAAETIPLGNVSFGQKQVTLYKMGRGIKLPDEVRQYVSLNLVSIYMQDFGIRLGMGLDVLALQVAMNGDQADGSDSAPVLGITTAGGPLVYRDYLRLWVRGSRLGKNFTTMISGEEIAMDTIELFRYNTLLEGRERTRLNLKFPIPDNSDLFVHGNIPDDQTLILDKAGALIKLNAQPLLVETERIVSNQTQATYATITTGFATMYRDSRLVLDSSLAFATNGWPTWMDPTTQENAIIE